MVVFLYMWKRPYLIVGWLWFICFLFPVSGVVRYMMESIALRYMYIPPMGLYLAVFTGISEFIRRRKPSTEMLRPEEEEAALTKKLRWYWTSVGIVTVVMAMLTFWENGLFRNTEAIALQTQKITGDRNAMCHDLLAVLKLRQGDLDEAEEHFKRCVEIQPENALFRYHYGGALYQLGKYEEVVNVMEPAIKAVPDAPEYLELYSLGLMATGNYPTAEEYLKKALAIEPETVSILQNLAYCLVLQGKGKEAKAHIEKALQLDPENQGLRQLQEMANQTDYIPVN